MKEALEQIKEDIIKHAKISGRKSEDITLIAVSKTYPAEAIEEAISPTTPPPNAIIRPLRSI
jgi:PLP dependent protein